MPGSAPRQYSLCNPPGERQRYCTAVQRDGEVEHRDLYLSPQEQAANDQMLPCCSRARSARLVLDL